MFVSPGIPRATIPSSLGQRTDQVGQVIGRRVFLGTLALLAAPRASEAQQAAGIARIGYLAPNLATGAYRGAFLRGLRDLGYVEGRNLVVEYRDVEGKFERFPALAAELVALKVDVIMAPGTLAALAAKRATESIPIVFPAVGDPAPDGLVASLARPGGNVTGLSTLTTELVGKCLELLHQTIPRVDRVSYLRPLRASTERTETEVRQRAEVAAQALGMRLHVIDVRGPEDFDRAFSDMTRARVRALIVPFTAMMVNERRRLVDLAARIRLPAVYGSRDSVDAGGLMSYGPDMADLSRRAAAYVDKILRGAKPGDLPVEQPTKFELVVNLKTAKTLGLAIPPPLLQRADQVIDP